VERGEGGWCGREGVREESGERIGQVVWSGLKGGGGRAPMGGDARKGGGVCVCGL
jgi:hypothetical protein